MAISHQVRPNGGWKYFESRTDTTIITLTWDDLVKAVADHRKSNGIPMGNPEQEVDEQLSKLHPSLVI